jgi:hypothetical protein
MEMKKRVRSVLLAIVLLTTNTLTAQAGLRYVDVQGNWRVVYESTDSWQTALAYRMKQGWGYFWHSYKAVTKTFGSTGFSSSWWAANRIKIYLKDPSVMDGNSGSMLPGTSYLKLNDEAIAKGDLSSNAMKYLGAIVAHEFGHVVFFQRTQLDKLSAFRIGTALHREDYLTEGLSWYIDSMVYKYRDSTYNSTATSVTNLKNQLRDWDDYYFPESWTTTGYMYYNADFGDTQWRLISIGYFLSRWPNTPNPSYSRISALMDSIRYYCYYRGYDHFDYAYKAVYGYTSGDTSTSRGPSVNTLYSKYYYWYQRSWN